MNQRLADAREDNRATMKTRKYDHADPHAKKRFTLPPIHDGADTHAKRKKTDTETKIKTETETETKTGNRAR